MRIIFTISILTLFFIASNAQNKAKIENLTLENSLEKDYSIIIIRFDINNYLGNERFLVNVSFWDTYWFNTVIPKSDCVIGANNSEPQFGGKNKKIVWSFDEDTDCFVTLHEGHFSIDLITLPKDITKDVIKKERLVEKQQKMKDKMNKSKKHGILYRWRSHKFNRLASKISRKNGKIELEIGEYY